MNWTRHNTGSPYIKWAKLCPAAKFNLATSGMVSLQLPDLKVQIAHLELGINSPSNFYGHEPLLEAIAQRYRVPRACVVSAMGTSLANYLALAAATDPGDEILVEQPTYDPLLAVAQYLGLEIRRFQRPAQQNFAVDLADLERNLSRRTRVVVLCNLHNPSGALVPDSTLGEITAMARAAGAYVLVDEVYREMMFEAEPQTAFHADPERFIITSSLTKAYGLSGLRCGWVLAPPELAARMWRIHDIHSSTYPYPAELLSTLAFENLAQIASRQKALLDENRRLLRGFLAQRTDLDCSWPEYGTVIFPRLKSGDVDALCDILYKEFETTVVPGRFFECADRFRIGVGMATDSVKASLQQLNRGLDRYRASLLAAGAL
jgi:aspartate/methionine/tyrosine aminotransferase